MTARHVSHDLLCPYEDCDTASPNVSQLSRHIMRQHEDETPRPFADLSHQLPPTVLLPPPLPELVRTEDLTTQQVLGSVYGSQHRQEWVKMRVINNCFGGDNPTLHVGRAPHMLGTALEDDSEDESDEEEMLYDAKEMAEKRLLDKAEGRRRRRWEAVVLVPHSGRTFVPNAPIHAVSRRNEVVDFSGELDSDEAEVLATVSADAGDSLDGSGSYIVQDEIAILDPQQPSVGGTQELGLDEIFDNAGFEAPDMDPEVLRDMLADEDVETDAMESYSTPAVWAMNESQDGNAGDNSDRDGDESETQSGAASRDKGRLAMSEDEDEDEDEAGTSEVEVFKTPAPFEIEYNDGNESEHAEATPDADVSRITQGNHNTSGIAGLVGYESDDSKDEEDDIAMQQDEAVDGSAAGNDDRALMDVVEAYNSATEAQNIAVEPEAATAAEGSEKPVDLVEHAVVEVSVIVSDAGATETTVPEEGGAGMERTEVSPDQVQIAAEDATTGRPDDDRALESVSETGAIEAVVGTGIGLIAAAETIPITQDDTVYTQVISTSTAIPTPKPGTTVAGGSSGNLITEDASPAVDLETEPEQDAATKEAAISQGEARSEGIAEPEEVRSDAIGHRLTEEAGESRDAIVTPDAEEAEEGWPIIVA